jgi:phage/plasmid-like protein (TIGR03299 family)
MPANVETMFSGRGITPWHKLGVIVEGTPTSAEAIKLAGLDWTVEKHPIFARIPDEAKTKAANNGKPHGSFKRVDSLYATVRMDTNMPLGVVGAKYHPIQNASQFELLDSLVSEGSAQYETAGSLGGGETVWMLLVATEGVRSIAGDAIRPYYLATSSHDGTGRLRVRNVATRVVCANTLAAAMGENVAREFAVSHTANAKDRMRQAASLLGLMQKSNQEFVRTAEDLLAVTFTKAEFEGLVATLIPKPDDSQPEVSTRMVRSWETKFEDVVKSAYFATDLNDIRYTKWGALNAIADFEQHHLRVKGTEQDRMETLFRRSFASGTSSLTGKAFAILTA